MNSKYTIKSRIWICSETGTFLGKGRIRLLEEIEATGSISEAAKRMHMSYKKAWGLVNSMNKQSKTPIVVRKIGGLNGGGSALSERGKKLISMFKAISQEHNTHLEKILNEHSI